MPSGHLYAIRAFLFPEFVESLINDDAYVGLHVVDIGYNITYEPLSVVSVACPINFHDYMKQKIRTHLGRLQLFMQNPLEISRVNRKFMHLSIREISSAPANRKLAALLHFILVILIRFLAFYKSRNHCIQAYSKWEPALSTKMHALQETNVNCMEECKNPAVA